MGFLPASAPSRRQSQMRRKIKECISLPGVVPIKLVEDEQDFPILRFVLEDHHKALVSAYHTENIFNLRQVCNNFNGLRFSIYIQNLNGPWTSCAVVGLTKSAGGGYSFQEALR